MMIRSALPLITTCSLLATTLPGCVASSRGDFPQRVVHPVQQPASNAHSSYLLGSASTPQPGASLTAMPVESATPAAVPSPEPPVIEPPAEPQFPRDQRRPHLIGLWGDELIENSAQVAGQHDGSGNIRQISFATEGATFDPDIDGAGTMLVYASTRHRHTADLYLQTVGGTSVTQLTSGDNDDIMPAFDPTAQSVAFASDRSGNWDIWAVPVTGGPPTQLTSDWEPELHPTWSPDGRHLAYCKFGSQSARWEIWVLDVENPATPAFLTFGVFPQWSPDVTASRILFQRARQRGSHYHSIWTIDFVDGEGRRPTEVLSAGNAALINPAWSPDGRHVVFITVVEPEGTHGQRPAQSDVWVTALDGTGRVNLTNGHFGNYQPVWAPGGTVFFVSDRDGVDNVWAVAASGAAELSPRESVVSADPEGPRAGGQP